MAIPPQTEKNIWVAAGDGDINRVRELVEQHSISPNAPDPYTYTPMHAAASYGHLDVLEYLISRGGDVNITDGDGDTPLYTVENIETAQFLITNGAIVDRQNVDGVSPIEHLNEDFPHVSTFLQTHSQIPASSSSTPSQPPPNPSLHNQNIASETLLSDLITSVQDIVRRAEAEGREPDEEELRRVVSGTVFDGVMAGFQMGEREREAEGEGEGRRNPSEWDAGADGDGEGVVSKRPKTE